MAMALLLVASQTYLAVVCCLTLTFAAILVRRLFIAPLASVPGPLGAALTGAWIWFLDMRGTSTEYIYKLHRKHGTQSLLNHKSACLNMGRKAR
jgi:hypothetical protein